MQRLLLLLSHAFLATAGLLAASPQDPQDVRRVPQEPDLETKIDSVFGDAINTLSYYPFLNIAPWFGIGDDPHLLRTEGGEPKLTTLPLRGIDQEVRSAQFSGTGNHVLVVTADGGVRVFTTGGKQVAMLDGETAGAGSALLFPDEGDFEDEGEIAVAGTAGAVRFYQADGTLKTTIDGFTGAVQAINYSATGRWFAAGDAAGKFVVWDGQGEIFADATSTNGIAGLSFSADESMLAVTDSVGGLRLYEITKPEEGRATVFATKTVAESGVVWAGFIPDDKRLMVVRDGKVEVYDEKGDLSLEAPTAEVNQVVGAEIETDDDTFKAVFHTGEGTRTISYDGTGQTLDTSGRPITAPDSGPLVAGGGELYLTAGAGQRLPHLGSYAEDGIYFPVGKPDTTVSTLTFDGANQRALIATQNGDVELLEWLVRDPAGAVVITSVPLVVLWLVIAAVLFTIYMKFVNFRMFGHAIQVVRGKYSNPDDKGEVTHFQALSSALSATVGLGNIAGVAIAVSVGGPGATFWMVVAGLLGMTLKFTECSLGQKFRRVDANGNVSGGPMHYLKDGLSEKGLGFLGWPLALIFTVFCIGGSLAGGNSFQVNQSLGILQNQVPWFQDNGWVYGVVMAVFVGIVIIGGIQRIASVAEKIVPTMCGIYVAAALVVIFSNIDKVGPAFAAIFGSALSGDAVYGGALGALIMGFRRAAFSNEAGVGSAAIAHSAAKTPYAVREGIVALLEPFIDTVVVCTMTALVIVISGVYQGNTEQTAEYVAGQNGAALTSVAFAEHISWFPWVLMAAVVLFAFSTMISWSYYGERCWTMMFGVKSSIWFKILFLVFVVLGSLVTATNILQFGDLMILLMAFPNIAGLYFLGGIVKRDLKEYETKLKAGEMKKFH